MSEIEVEPARITSGLDEDGDDRWETDWGDVSFIDGMGLLEAAKMSLTRYPVVADE